MPSKSDVISLSSTMTDYYTEKAASVAMLLAHNVAVNVIITICRSVMDE